MLMFTRVKCFFIKHYNHGCAEYDMFSNDFNCNTVIIEDVFDHFCKSPPEIVNDILKYWTNSSLIPLKRFAVDVLSCPASSSGIESIFSEMKNIITDNRRRMTADNLCYSQLIKSWDKIIL